MKIYNWKNYAQCYTVVCIHMRFPSDIECYAFISGYRLKLFQQFTILQARAERKVAKGSTEAKRKIISIQDAMSAVAFYVRAK